MLKLSEMRGDIMGRFQNALYLGDVKEQVGATGLGGQGLELGGVKEVIGCDWVK